MGELSLTQEEAIRYALTTVRAITETEVPDPNNGIVVMYRGCIGQLRESNPEMFQEGADMTATRHRIEKMTLRCIRAETFANNAEAQRSFTAFCASEDYYLDEPD